MKDSILKDVFTGHVGDSISGMRYRILGPLFAQQSVTSFGTDSIKIIDALLGERHSSHKNSSDVIARATYYKIRAGMINGALDTYSNLFGSLSSLPHSYYQDVMKIFPSEEPLCEVLKEDTDERIMRTFYREYEHLTNELKHCYEQIAKNMTVGLVPSLCMKDAMVVTLVDFRDAARIANSNEGAAAALTVWLSTELGKDFSRTLLVPDGAVELTDDLAVNVIDHILSLTDNMNETSHSMSTLDFVNHMCVAIGASSLMTHNVTAVLDDFREYCMVPVNSIRETFVVVENKDETGSQPTIMSNETEAKKRNLDVLATLSSDDCSVIAFLTAKVVGLVCSPKAGSTAANKVLMGDLLMSAECLVEPAIIERVVYETAKKAKFKEDLEWFELMKGVAANRGKNATLTEMSQKYDDAYAKDVQAVSRMFARTLNSSFMSDVGHAMDTIRSKDGTKKRWYYCPHVDDGFEMSLNSGGLKQIAETGVVQMKTNFDVQYFPEWATGTVEGTTEGIVRRSSLRENVYTGTLSQSTVLEHAGDVLNYYYGGGKRVRYDFRAVTAMEVIDSFRDGDRWLEPGQVPSRVYSSELAKLCRTQPLGDNLIFSTMMDDLHFAPLAGTAMSYQEQSDSYICVDKSIKVGVISKRGGLQNGEDMHSTAGRIILLIVRDLLNGHFSQMMPEIKNNMPVSLEQKMTKAQRRVANFDAKFEKIFVRGDITARFQANPAFSRQIGDLFPAEERWNRRYEEMFIRRDIAEHYRTLIDVHVRTLKRSLGSVGGVSLALRYVEGTISEKDLFEMKRDEKGINLINTLIETITSVVGLRFNGNEGTSSAPYELRVFLLQELHKKLEEFGSLKSKIDLKDVIN
jgi:hypothetical protein